jgi:hypothetical protein
LVVELPEKAGEADLKSALRSESIVLRDGGVFSKIFKTKTVNKSFLKVDMLRTESLSAN